MKSGRPTFLSITLTFVAALVFYLIAYSWLTKKQTSKGPWTVLFTNDVAGIPELVIAQGSLGLTNVHVQFAGEKLSATQSFGVIHFSAPRMALPFGEVVYDDLMFLPGTVTLDCFGHEVELLPRALILDRKEVQWISGSTNLLTPGSKLSVEARKLKKKRRDRT